jgi:tetratricopeptide (TPR) repeat protein/outer membrane lipoprotein-sorting protein
MRPVENVNDLIKKLQLKASSDLDTRVHADISAALVGYEKTRSARSGPNIWRTIMTGKTAKLAVAAVVLIGVLVLTSVFVKTNESVVLADVLDRVERARAFMYKMDMTVTGSMMPGGRQEMHGTMIISDEYGMKWKMGMPDPNTGERVTTEMYVLPDQKVSISLMPQQKKYQRMEFDDDWLANVKREKNDPRETLRRMMDCSYTELGRKEIDGIEAEGFETTDPKFSGGFAEGVKVTLWVDVETCLPVLWEMDITMNEQMSAHGVLSDFQWDIPVVASDFEPVIPEDFTSMIDDGYKMPSMTEEAALEGLKLFADMSGQYPKKVDMISLMREFTALKAGEGLTAANVELKEEVKRMAEGEDRTEAAITKTMEARIKARVTKRMEMMRPVQSLAMFYMTLVQEDKEPVYYGETVGPDDANAVLMRWRISDGQYRVVFGNLSTSDVSAKELAELEEFSVNDGYKRPSVTEKAAREDRVMSTAADHYDRGQAHYLDGEYDQAFSELAKAIEIDPRLARAYVIRGIAYNDKGEHNLAIADFSKVIEIEPTNARAYVSRGMAYGNKGEYDLAIADHSRAIEIDPTLTDPYRLRARAYTYKGEYDKAWKDVYQAQALGRPVDSKLLEKLREASGRNE